MKPCESYQHHTAAGWTRIEVLLALYDGAIARIELAIDALARRDKSLATPLLLRTQRIVAELMAGLDLNYGDVPRNLHRLYGFVLRSLEIGTDVQLSAALEVMCTLREGLDGIRAEANALERSGAVPALDFHRIVQAIG